MNRTHIYIAGSGTALHYAGQNLIDRGISVVSAPAPDVTHLLLPVPSFESDGRIRGGGVLEHILGLLPPGITVIGGNLQHPALENYRKVDLLQDPLYLAQNAAITADCAMRILGRNLPTVFAGCPVLIIGWGRIGKCLAAQLKACNADVTVAARKPADQAILRALGYQSADPKELTPLLCRYRAILNTVPAPVLNKAQMTLCRSDCIRIELASTNGMAGSNIIPARGLPGRDAPEASGLLIANTVVRILAQKEDAL